MRNGGVSLAFALFLIAAPYAGDLFVMARKTRAMEN